MSTNTSVITRRYYPTLASIVNKIDPPKPLEFLENPIQELFEKIHFKDLQYSKSPRGDSASYSLSVVSPNRFDFPIPETDLKIVLNPDLTGSDPSISSYPITLDWKWKILSHLRTFAEIDIESITTQEIFELALTALNISEEQAIAHIINTFADPLSTLSPYMQYVNNMVTLYPDIDTPSDPITEETPLDEVIRRLYEESTGMYATLIAFGFYILSSDPNETLETLKSFFKAFIPKDIKEYIKDILIPKASTSLSLAIGIEFPRSLLRPIDSNTGLPFTDDTIKSLLTYSAGTISISTENGIEFDPEGSINLSLSQIGNTALRISLSNAQIDLNENSNIAAATLDGRSNSFKGVFVEEATVELPTGWLNGTGTTIVANNMLIGTEGGVSGIVTIQGVVFELYVDIAVLSSTSIDVDVVTQEISVTSANGQVEVLPFPPYDIVNLRTKNKKYFEVPLIAEIEGQQPPEPTEVLVPPSETLLEFEFGNDFIVRLNSFFINFKHNEIVSSCIIGELQLPIDDNNGDPLIFDIQCQFENGFLIKVSNSNGLPLINNSNVEVILNGLEIGKQDALWKLGFSGSIENKASFPAISDLIPKRIDVNEFSFQSGQPLNYDVNIEWPGGLTVGGTDENGIRAYIPINKTIGDVASLEAISIMIDGGEDGTELLVELKNAGLKLGPASVKIDGFGMKATIAASTSGNLGPFDVDLEIIPPSGLSITVESAILSGGGILVYKPNDGSFMGGLVLSFKKISLSAIGILNTQMEDGSSGFSLLIIITTTFTPTIQLGMGFNLGGVGGLLGINRTIKNTELQAGVKNGSLDMILFPSQETVNSNPFAMISQVAGIFPVMSKHFVLGPMAKISWGTPSIITLDFGIFIELPDPKIAVIGVLKSVLPSEEKCIVRIQVNFAGYLDFQQKELMFFASIYNSKIMSITLQGDMGLLINWGSRPLFILSAGGFHPSYVVPPNNLPALQRMSVSLCDTDSLQVKFESYFAVTSNSVQFGAASSLRAEMGKFFAKGDVGFDVLVLFNPFYFEVGIYFKAEAGMNSRVYTSCDIDAHLTGPNSWHVWGKASFRIIIKINFSFNKTIGQKQNEIQPSIEVTGQLLEAFGRDENWEFLAEDTSLPGVSLAELNPNLLFFHPNGVLQVKQSYLPLGITLEKCGNSKISDAKKFTITNILVAEEPISPFTGNIQKDYFCPGEYIELSKDERLSRPSFELYECGVKFSLPGIESTKSSKVLARNLGTTDTVVVPPAATPFLEANSNLAPVGSEFYEKFTSNNGFFNNSSIKPFIELMSSDGTKINMGSRTKKTYGVNRAEDLTDYDNIRFDSFTEAEQYLKEVLTNEPELEEELMVHYK